LDITNAGIAEDIGIGNKNPIIPQIYMIYGEIEVLPLIENDTSVTVYLPLPDNLDDDISRFYRTTGLLEIEYLYENLWKEKPIQIVIIPNMLTYGYFEKRSLNVIETDREGKRRAEGIYSLTTEPARGSAELIYFEYLDLCKMLDKEIGFIDLRMDGIKAREREIIEYRKIVKYTDAEHEKLEEPMLLDNGIVNGRWVPLRREIHVFNSDNTVDVYKDGKIIEYGISIDSYVEIYFSEMIRNGKPVLTSKAKYIVDEAKRGNRIVIGKDNREIYIDLKPLAYFHDVLQSYTSRK
jgi:hypothetical protein